VHHTDRGEEQHERRREERAEASVRAPLPLGLGRGGGAACVEEPLFETVQHRPIGGALDPLERRGEAGAAVERAPVLP